MVGLLWLEREFGWSDDTAFRYMKAACGNGAR